VTTQGPSAKVALSASYPSSVSTLNGVWTASMMVVVRGTGAQPTLVTYAVCSL
jgi:hypothetical protein